MDGKFLSEVIDWKRDIEPYSVIQIYSGVGSGKNWWVETLAEQGYSILLITSRTITANSQAGKMNGSRKIKIEDFLEHKGKEKQCVVVTNAGIEKYVKEQYKAEEESTHIWKYFDIIVLDEAHSLVTDSFADSSFYVEKFLRARKTENPKCKMIFMTGTPAPIEEFFPEEVQQSPTYKYLDFYNACKHVEPETVTLFPSSGIEREIVSYLQAGERIIYFANTIKRIEQLISDLTMQGVDEEQIGVAYSDNEKHSIPDTIFNKKNQIKDSLAEKEKLPEDVRLFLTTSQNQEGVNIKDDDIQIMIAERHERSALIQMVGRVREGVEHFVILYDAQQLHSTGSELEAFLDLACDRKNIMNECLNDLQEYLERTNDLDSVIKLVHRKFPFIRYNYIKKKFQFYKGRDLEAIQTRMDREYLRECIDNWGKPPFNGMGSMSEGELALSEWFPYSELYYVPEENLLEEDNRLQIAMEDVLQPYLRKEFDKAEKNHLLEQLQALLQEKRFAYDRKRLDLHPKMKQLAAILKRVGYTCTQKGKKKDSPYELKKNV